MELQKILYHNYRWATTNPPQNYSRDIIIEKTDSGYVIKNEVCDNSFSSKKEYPLSDEQLERIIALFTQNDIYFGIEEAKAYEQRIPIMQVGGASGASLSVETDEYEIHTSLLTDKLNAFINEINALYAEASDGDTSNNNNVSGAVKVEVWKCLNCGYESNRGNYCEECGSAKNNNNQE